MEITVDEALQRGVAAHKEGKLQEAEKFYRGILGVQPNHPDANHNLGVLAIHFGKIDLALPHFKTALEANANQEQYWFSYIEGLIGFGQLEAARQVLAQGRQRGLKGDKVDQLDLVLLVLYIFLSNLYLCGAFELRFLTKLIYLLKDSSLSQKN